MTTIAGLCASSAGELAERIDASHQRFADLARTVPEDLGVEGGWRVRDVVAHMVDVLNRYTAFAPDRLADTPQGVAVVNDRELHAHATKSFDELRDRLDAEMERFRVAWGPQHGRDLGAPVPFHAGITLTLQGALTNVIAEFLVHGLDVAVAAARPWPIEVRDAQLVADLLAQAFPFYVRADNLEELQIRLELDGMVPWALGVDGATGTSRPPSHDDRPDIVLAGPAGAFVLAAYGRAAWDGSLRVIGGARPDSDVELSRFLERP